MRFERLLDATADEVWEALVEPDRLRRWLGETTLDARRGGTVDIRFGDESAGHRLGTRRDQRTDGRSRCRAGPGAIRAVKESRAAGEWVGFTRGPDEPASDVGAAPTGREKDRRSRPVARGIAPGDPHDRAALIHDLEQQLPLLHDLARPRADARHDPADGRRERSGRSP